MAAGCSSESAPPKQASVKPSQPFELGNLVEPFDAPPMDELDKLQWVDGPLIDSLEQLRSEKAEQGPPKTTVAEALELRNDFPRSRAANDKILDAMSQLAPADGSGVDYDHTFVRHVAGDLNSTNPLFMSSITDAELSALSGLYLIGFNRRFEYFADKDVVKSWQRSTDNLVERFVLRDDLTWSDGAPVTAEDVEFTYRLIMSDHPELVIPSLQQGPDQLRYVKAYDDHTVVMWHKEPFATRTGNMNWPIIPKHIYEKSIYEDPSMKRSAHHRKYEQQPVTAGPYELVSRVRNQEFVVRRREAWRLHDGQEVRRQPYFQEVRVKVIEDLNTAILALKAGDIQEMELRPEHWESLTDGEDFYRHNTKVMAPEWTEFHVIWNLKSPYFSDKRVRWAMTCAFDYDELLNTICRGLYEPSVGTFDPTAWMFPKNGPQPVKRDLDKAEDLLDEAGWTDSDGDGTRDKEINGQLVPLEFQLMTYTTETGIQVATLWKESLEQIGVAVNVKPTEFAVMQDKTLKHEFDATFAGWGTGTDPDQQENIFGTGFQRNYGQYSNPEVDKLFQQGRRELDQAQRAEIYGKIHLLLWEDQPYTWLFRRNAFYGFNKKIRGYNFSPKGPFDFGPGISAFYGAFQ
ncbi:MAG: peptide ABC transporter substrate-binding protein [Pirellulales bacterium]|nr:peptide ABC transporter substrate-binding protein [Pirellulales bacterium]